MRRLAAMLVLVTCAWAANARAAISTGSGKPSGDGSFGFDKKAFVTWAGVTDASLSAFHIGWALAGRKANRSVAGFQIALTAPVVIYGANMLRADDDPMIAVGTAWAALLLCQSVYVLTRPAESPPLSIPVGSARLAPAIDGQGAGVALFGEF